MQEEERERPLENSLFLTTLRDEKKNKTINRQQQTTGVINENKTKAIHSKIKYN